MKLLLSNISSVGVVIHVKKVELLNGVVTNCLWISQDPEQLGEAAQQLVNVTLASSFSQSMTASSLCQTPTAQVCTVLLPIAVYSAAINTIHSH